MQNLLQYWNSRQDSSGTRAVPVRWLGLALAVAGFVLCSAVSGKAQSTGDPTPEALELGPRCPTCPIVIASRPMSAKDKQDRADRSMQKRDFSLANAARKQYIDDETNKMLILARDLKEKIDGMGAGRPSAVMQREAAVIEFLAKDIKEKMKLTVNPD